MTKHNEILQERYKLTKEAEKIALSAKDGQMTAEQRERFDKMMADIDRLGKAAGLSAETRSPTDILLDQGEAPRGIIENIGIPDDIVGGIVQRGDVMIGNDGKENRFIDAAKGGFLQDVSAVERADFKNSLGRMLLARIKPKYDQLNSWEGRALAEGAVAGGGFLAPIVTSKEVWEATRVSMVAAKAGARFVEMHSKELDLIVQQKDAVATWVPEGAMISDDSGDVVFGRMKLNMKKAAVIITVNKELILDSPNAQQVLMDSIVYAVQKVLDYGVFYGTGAGDQPMGLYNDPLVATQSTVTDFGGTAPFGFDEAITANYAIIANNYPGTGSGISMIMSPAAKMKIDRLRGNDGSFLVGDVSNIPQSVNWQRCYVTQQISGTAGYPGRDVFIGPFDQYLIGAGNYIEVQNTEYTSDQWSKYQYSFRCILRADGGTIRPSWWYVAKNAA
ncbi:MAG: phage major capsid protein [Spirochaetia bacterium]